MSGAGVRTLINDTDDDGLPIDPLTLCGIGDDTASVHIRQDAQKYVLYDAVALYTHCVKTRRLPPEDPMSNRPLTDAEMAEIAARAGKQPLHIALSNRTEEIDAEKRAEVLSEELNTELQKCLHRLRKYVSRIWQRRVNALTVSILPDTFRTLHNIALFDRENAEDALQQVCKMCEAHVVCEDDRHMLRGALGEKIELLRAEDGIPQYTALETVLRIQGGDRMLAMRLTNNTGMSLMMLGNGDD